MKSKVKEYQQLYTDFEKYYENVSNQEKPIQEIQLKKKELKAEQSKFDYNNSDIAIEYMKTYMDESIQKEKDNIKNDVDNSIKDITNNDSKVKKNYKKAVKILSKEKADKYLRSLNMEGEDTVIKPDAQDKKFIIVSALNGVLANIFRFRFMGFLHVLARIVLACFIWMNVFITFVADICANKYDREYYNILESASLSGSYSEYNLIWDEMYKKTYDMCVTVVVVITVLIVAINIIVYFAARVYAKKYLYNNRAACMVMIDSSELRQKMYDEKLTKYMNGTVEAWKKEIEMIKEKGVPESPDENSLILRVKKELFDKYNSYNKNINDCDIKINKIRDSAKNGNAQLQYIIPRLKEKEKEVTEFVSDRNYNNSVLSPYVSAGYSQYTIRSVRKLIYFNHNYNPMLMYYDDNTVKDGERFRRNAAKLIEMLMKGFYQENYHANINMYLVDFEGLAFPKSRTQGMMEIINNQQDVKLLFENLKKTRDAVNSLGNGKISSINQDKLKNGDNPIKYNIVFFIGYDFTSIDKEISQLFIRGQDFGFLPIIFMRKSLAQSILNSNNALSAFTRVMEKINADNQTYAFESVVSEFEYDVMISNQKQLLEENVCVKNIYSIDEFVQIVNRGGKFKTNVIYLDAYQLGDNIYKYVENRNYIKLFTINNQQAPWYVKKEVIKL
jgi:hypothetical protein